MQAVHQTREIVRRPLAAADALMNRLTTWRFNPLYQSGTLVVASFLVMLATGLYLLLFYRIGSPYESIERIDAQLFAGRWIRALHRYAADLAVVAGALHALRMFVQGRSWGARSLAWISGLVLFFLVFVCGWTGYVMLWDAQAQALAIEGARLLDALPIFSEPIARTFVGNGAMPSAFFFLNLFLHIAIPIGMALGLWVHVSRLARPVLLPEPGLLWGCVGLLFAASLLFPAPLGSPARLDALLGRVELDFFYSFWLPASRALRPGAAWLALGIGSVALVCAPLWTRPARSERPEPSLGNEHLCTGCDQCTLDCPYQAIAMVPRPEAHGAGAERVARVQPELCVSCGICSASCAPMAVGPPGRTGRDELAEVRAVGAAPPQLLGDVVVVACRRAAGRVADASELDDAAVVTFSCAGNVHTSAVELLLRAGASGALVWSCPPRDCWFREGPHWLEQRLHHGREAELRESVDRRRLRITYAGEGEQRLVHSELAAFRRELAALAPPRGNEALDVAAECERSAGPE
jgi:coenzyme F420-reducing hydrogenase delta subunit/Pyruvate/2-oxoacid:ferredoxin oxidoreductase delta subunit